MADSRRPDLAITGVAIANCLGDHAGEVYARAFAGEDRFRPASDYFAFPFESLLGIMPAGDEARTRVARVALASVRQIEPAVAAAVDRWGPRRVAYVFASSTGGLEQTERFLAPHERLGPVDYRYADHGIDATCRDFAAYLGIEGLRVAVATACSSSLNALATAARFIEHGLADAAVVGSADSLTRTTIFGFHALGLLAPTATRPFAEDRQGITLGEGSAFVLVERDGGARALARVAGLGASSDAFHQTSPHPDGAGAEACMRQALARAGLEPSDIDLVSAHATGTRQNDAVEGAALARMFGDRVPVTASKSLFGHTLGTSGLAALVLSVEALRRQEVPPTLRATPVDPALAPLALVHAPARARLRHVLVNAFGFGGSNATAVVAL